MIAAWTAQAQFSYYFFDENNEWRTIPSEETPAIKITDATTTLNQNDAWYLIEDDISLSECTVTGKNVHLFIPEYGWTDRSNEIIATRFEADHISIANDQVFIVDNVWLEGELSTEQITKLSNADILNPPTMPVPDNIPQFEKLKEVYNIDYDGKFHSVLELLGNPVVENPYGKIVYDVGGTKTEDPKVQSPGEYTILLLSEINSKNLIRRLYKYP